MINGYQNILHQSPSKMRLRYADSMVYSAKKSADNALLGSAYLSKGIVYYGRKQQDKAMDNYLIANNYISKTDDLYLKYKVKYHIALSKLYIGFYDEAISLLRECTDYYKDHNPRPYLNSLHSLGLSYNKSGDYGLCTQTNILGIAECLRLDQPEMKPYFLHSQGINEYFLTNYSQSIKNIKSSLDVIKDNSDFANVAIGNFYLGKDYWALGKKQKAVEYFTRVDKIFNEKHYLRPDLRQSFELLISYFRQQKDVDSQLYYIKQLLKADTLLTETSRYIAGKIHKEYDTKELVSQMDKLQSENDDLTQEMVWEKNYDWISAILIFVLFMLITWLTFRHYRNKTLFKKRYEEYVSQIGKPKNILKNDNEKLPLKEINAETVTAILKQLDKFERDKKFLERDWKQGSLAAYLNSNSNYLALIIKHHRAQNFSEYINGLRVDYIVALLQKEKKYRNYTNNALAKEAGFSSTQRFANAFLTKMGIPVIYFVAQLKKED
ncbi:helix-turn-helix domain-containing protein [Flavobacterium agrisoli]|uniref:AraC family transcriptional regulator n=1 Tax=Flavobacterium agrisoli TaxID=2793066 RepID=A0A934PK61_9FLAO|nr:helix-turn-helix domain-containing protein [Flavobacterium agrisoli]MBK0368240.1 AraC family transcriptional regulator [Flavobacterium agrisoli]